MIFWITVRSPAWTLTQRLTDSGCCSPPNCPQQEFSFCAFLPLDAEALVGAGKELKPALFEKFPNVRQVINDRGTADKQGIGDFRQRHVTGRGGQHDGGSLCPFAF